MGRSEEQDLGTFSKGDGVPACEKHVGRTPGQFGAFFLGTKEKLMNELKAGRIDAALDVFDEESLPADEARHILPNVLLTPHEAGGTIKARMG
jgi:D-isomer specific 2-hydroxyacid dehydrogenase, NAD binding domain